MVSYVITERESDHLELKSAIPKYGSLIKTCIAFAKAAGGRIIIGVEDSSGEVTGVSDDDRFKIYNGFQNSLYDAASPCLIAQIYEQNFGGTFIFNYRSTH